MLCKILFLYLSIFVEKSHTSSIPQAAAIIPLLGNNINVAWYENDKIMCRLFEGTNPDTNNTVITESSPDNVKIFPSAVYLSTGNILVVWTNYHSTLNTFDIWGTIMDISCSVLIEEFQISTETYPANNELSAPYAAQIVMNELVIWNNGKNIVGRTLTSTGVPLDQDQIIYTLPGNNFNQNFANSGNEVFVAWTNMLSTGETYICGTLCNQFGTQPHSYINISNNLGYLSTNPTVAGLINTGWIITWQGQLDSVSDPEQFYIFATIITSSGSIQPPFVIAAETYPLNTPTVFQLPDMFVFVWESNSSIVVQFLSGTTPIGDVITVSESSYQQSLPTVGVMSNYDFLVVWLEQDNYYGRMFYPNGTFIGETYQIN